MLWCIKNVIIFDMNTLAQELKSHFHEVLGLQIRCERWEEERRFPPFLREEYELYKAQILNTDCIILFDQHTEEKTPGVIAKHIERVREKWDDPVIYVREALTSYNRKRLIEQKVPFLVPHNQLYLPDLGLDLREHFKKIRAAKMYLSPSAQVILIYALLSESSKPEFTTSQLADHFGYSAMTYSRAFDEISDAELGEIRKNNRKKSICLSKPKKQVWEEAQSWLRSPVKNYKWVSQSILPMNFPEAGISALTRYSMIAEPRYPEIAMSQQEFKQITEMKSFRESPYADQDSVKLEIWHYSPGRITDKPYVDPLSLYLCLKDSNDERIQGALNEMMEQLPW